MGAQGRRLLMEFKTAEQKLLHDYAALEDENARLEYDNGVLGKRIAELEERVKRLEVERDHHADCVKDILATAAFYGFEQPTRIMFNPETRTMQPAEDDEDDGKCVIFTRGGDRE